MVFITTEWNVPEYSVWSHKWAQGSFKPIHSLPSLSALPVLILAHCLTRRCSWLPEAASVSVHQFLVDRAVEDKAARGCLLFSLWICRIAKPQKMSAQHLMELAPWLMQTVNKHILKGRPYIKKRAEVLQPWQHPVAVAVGFFQYPAHCLY